MSVSSDASVPAVPSAPVVLGRFVELLVRAARTGSGPPLVLRLRSTGDGIELATSPVDDVYADLAGSSLSADWHGLGVVVSGRARSLGDPDRGARPGDLLGSAVTALVVWRDGTVVSALSLDHDEPRVQIARPGDELGRAVVGRLVDVVRRAAGLGTEAPTAPPADLGAKLWLHRVHATAVDGAPVDLDLVEATVPPIPSSWTTWREQCADGVWPDLGIPAHLAAWMDDGMFSREALGAFPDTVEVLEHLADLVPPSVWRHLVDRLARTTRRLATDTWSSELGCSP